MKNSIAHVVDKIDILWYRTPLAVRLLSSPALICVGLAGFILLCLAGPILVILALGLQIFRRIKNAAS